MSEFTAPAGALRIFIYCGRLFGDSVPVVFFHRIFLLPIGCVDVLLEFLRQRGYVADGEISLFSRPTSRLAGMSLTMTGSL